MQLRALIIVIDEKLRQMNGVHIWKQFICAIQTHKGLTVPCTTQLCYHYHCEYHLIPDAKIMYMEKSYQTEINKAYFLQSLFGYVGRILRKNIITTIIRYIWTFLSAVSTLYIQLKTDFVKNLYYHIHSGKNSQDKNPKQRDSTILSMVYLSYSVHCTLYKIEVFLDRWLNHDRLFSCTHHKTHLCSRYWFDHHVKFQPELRWAWYSYCPNHLATLPESMYPEPSIITISKVMALNSSFWSTARTNEGSLSRILCLMHHLTRWRLLCSLVSTSTLWCSFLYWKIRQPFVPLKNNRRYIC